MPPFEELNESNAKLLNEMACIILFTGKFYCLLINCRGFSCLNDKHTYIFCLAQHIINVAASATVITIAASLLL